MATKPSPKDRPRRRIQLTYESEGEGSRLPFWLTVTGVLLGLLGLVATVAFGSGIL